MMSANDESSLDEDFGQLFEQSLKSVKPGEVVTGKVVQIANGLVTVDIGYKSEGQIPINEFRDRDGNIEVQVGDDVDVYFEASEGDTGAVSLSRAKAEQVKVWRDIEIAYNEYQFAAAFAVASLLALLALVTLGLKYVVEQRVKGQKRAVGDRAE